MVILSLLITDQTSSRQEHPEQHFEASEAWEWKGIQRGSFRVWGIQALQSTRGDVQRVLHDALRVSSLQANVHGLVEAVLKSSTLRFTSKAFFRVAMTRMNVSYCFVLKKMGQSRPLFVYFRSFHIPIQMTNINWKSIDGVLGTRTQGGRMEGADESTEL